MNGDPTSDGKVQGPGRRRICDSNGTPANWDSLASPRGAGGGGRAAEAFSRQERIRNSDSSDSGIRFACRRSTDTPPSRHVCRHRSRRRSHPRGLRDRWRAVGCRRAAPAVPWHHGQRQGAGAGKGHRWLDATATPTSGAAATSEEEGRTIMPPDRITIPADGVAACHRPDDG